MTSQSDELGPQAKFEAFLKEGRFMIQRCKATGTHVFYPRVAVPGTGGTDFEWVEASGLGTVYSATLNRSRSGNANVVLVDLDEGPRMMSRVEGAEVVPIGARVQARIAQIDDAPAVVFDLIPSTDGEHQS
ncbi:MAG: OB-fold domain-containing protein [Pseudomonadota bacterium]